jgi:hypothetical protein
MNKKWLGWTILVFLAFTVVFSGSVMAGKKNQSGATAILTEQEKEALLFMREEEKLARDVYHYLYDFWGQWIFSNIETSEQQHMDAILNLLDKYGLDDPVGDSRYGVFQNPDLQDLYDELVIEGVNSELDAIKVGIRIEVKDIEDLIECLDLTDNKDITQVFTNLMNGSVNHLAAFNSHLSD